MSGHKPPSPEEERSDALWRINDALHSMEEEWPTLRDRFAMAALPAVLDNEWGGENGDEWCAEAAYKLADAMLAARKETP